MLSIQGNNASIDAQLNLNNTQTQLNSTLEQLSSGYRINSAGDDAAGAAISTKLEAQVNGLNQATQNANDGIDMIQTAEGALSTVTSMLQRMRELAVEASNSTLSSQDLGAINTELQQLSTEVNNISAQTQFNGQGLLSGALTTAQNTTTSTALVGNVLSTTGGTATIANIDVSGASAGDTYTFSAGANPGSLTLTQASTGISQTVNVSAVAANGSNTISFSNLGVNITLDASAAGKTAAGIVTDITGSTIKTAAGSGAANIQVGANASDSMNVSFGEIDISANGMSQLNTALQTFNGSQTVSNAQALITAVDSGIDLVNAANATLGAYQDRLQNVVSNLGTMSENLSASDNGIKDVDVAAATSQMTQQNILMQAGISVLSQANQEPQLALKLLSQ